MVKRCVRVYVEGGAEGRVADSDFRRGWKTFLNDLHLLARDNGYHSLEIVRGKGRANTFRGFTNHQAQHPNDLCVLLVDAETEAPEGIRVWDVVARRAQDSWQRPNWATERHLYLMAHFVETWLLTDQDALQEYFRRGFNSRPLPTTNLESRPKNEIENALTAATRNSSRGEYCHGQAHEIIGMIRTERVRTLRHGRRLFEVLSSLIRDESER
jgi:hypothetical protein